MLQKKSKTSRKASVFAMFATLMLLIGMFVPAVAYAETPRDQY
ncbi:MAG: hypothetical protein C5S43_01520 [Candidatus Methanocomedens sp.]|nr:MAG: hypothetical protein C5S43_01520 [ANME-2 cluster archaeon]